MKMNFDEAIQTTKAGRQVVVEEEEERSSQGVKPLPVCHARVVADPCAQHQAELFLSDVTGEQRMVLVTPPHVLVDLLQRLAVARLSLQELEPLAAPARLHPQQPSPHVSSHRRRQLKLRAELLQLLRSSWDLQLSKGEVEVRRSLCRDRTSHPLRQAPDRLRLLLGEPLDASECCHADEGRREYSARRLLVLLQLLHHLAHGHTEARDLLLQLLLRHGRRSLIDGAEWREPRDGRLGTPSRPLHEA
mmetsp:Transcript_1517/g.4592  ORF Transcript_1517/g.4592 Transcript_1517/m.4592 type:complete len:247 (-) Transcript_1517:1082-1822(-)